MLRRTLLLCTILLTFCAPTIPHLAAAQPPDDGATSAMILRIRDAAAHADALADEFDLLEMRDGADLFILGDAATAERLRERGFVVAVQRALPRQRTQSYYGGYHTVAEQFHHLDAVAAAHADLVQLIDYGDSWRKQNERANGHDLRAVCITRRQSGDCALSPDAPKPRFFVMAAIHARELTVGELAWRWIDYLVDNYGVDADVTTMLDTSEMWIVPLANPDGRSIVESGGDSPYYHRKNANDVDGSCASYSPGSSSYAAYHPGIDLNRNGSWKWDLRISASDSKCSAVFRGPSVASEPENIYLEALLRQLFRDERGPALTDAAPLTTTGAFITLHSFGDLVILPWNYSTALHAPNDAGLRAFAFRMSRFNGYRTGQSGQVLYSTSGSTDDFTYGALGVASYTFEVGPGYGLCADFMPPFSCVDEFWSRNLGALLYAAKAARQPYTLAHGPMPQAIAVDATVDGAVVRTLFDDDAFGTNGVDRPSAQHVVSAELFLDAPPWAGNAPITMQPIDGAANSNSKEFSATLRLSVLDSARHIVYARAYDADGNAGVFAAAWISPGAASVLPDIVDAHLDRSFIVTDATANIVTIVSTTLPFSITAAQVQIDANNFVTNVLEFSPIDGAANSTTETFTTTLDGSLLTVGLHTATLRALTYSATYTPTRELTFSVLPPGYRNVYVPVAIK